MGARARSFKAVRRVSASRLVEVLFGARALRDSGGQPLVAVFQALPGEEKVDPPLALGGADLGLEGWSDDAAQRQLIAEPRHLAGEQIALQLLDRFLGVVQPISRMVEAH